MSFSSMAKNELARVLPEKKCCQLAELAALIRMDGTIQIGYGQNLILSLSTENAAVARKIFKLSKMLFDYLEMQIAVTKKRRLKKNNVYQVRVPFRPRVTEAFEQLGLRISDDGYTAEWNPRLVAANCCRKAYLRGAFLGGGSVNNPEGTYHLEIITKDAFHSRLICRLMEAFGLKPRISRRKQWQVVYLKESEQIVDFLNVIGAHSALLSFENTRVVKDMRNRVNRLVNCETANLNKTVDAGLRQVEIIRLIQTRLGLEKLPLSLREIARLRLEFPDVSLKELGEMLNPPVSKSGANHRIRRLEKIAESLGREK